MLTKIPSDQRNLDKPGWGQGRSLRRGLDGCRSIGDTGHMCLLERKCCAFPSQRGTFYSTSLLLSSSLRIAWIAPRATQTRLSYEDEPRTCQGEMGNATTYSAAHCACWLNFLAVPGQH